MSPSASSALIAMVLGLSVVGCSGMKESGSQPGPVEELPTVFGGDRPVELHVPSTYEPGVPTPLVILLHGYTATGMVQELYWNLKPEAERRGVLYAHPDGTRDKDGSQFWNATQACCDFGNTGIDDSSYLRSLIDEIGDHYAVDPKRIYFTGHSNGAYMSYRMACDHADTVAAIAGLAGAMFKDSKDCAASEPVNVLHIHGDQDSSVSYDGTIGDSFSSPGARESVQFWADRAACESEPTAEMPLDLDPELDGAETQVDRWQGCMDGGAAELWSMRGVGHIPDFDKSFAKVLFEHLLAHSKP